MQKTRATRHVIVVDNSHVARRVGDRIRIARQRARLTQRELASGRYTGAYISALERGLAKPSMAALTFISERLGVPITNLVAEDESAATRLEADLLLASGDYVGAVDRYDDLVDRTNDRRVRAELLRGRAEALCRLGRAEEAIAAASEAAQTFDELGMAPDAAWARYWLAYAHYLHDNPAEARSLLHELLAVERGGLHVAPDFRFRLLTSLGHVEAWDRQPERAIAYMEEARALTGELSLFQRAAFLAGLVTEYRHAGDLERSVRAGAESLALYRAAEAEREAAGLENNLALTFLELGNSDRAEQHIAAARDVATRLGDPALLSEIAETEAQISWARGHGERAREQIAAVLATLDAGGSHVAVANAHLTRARIERDGGSPDAARADYEAAANLLRERGPRGRLRETLAEWAEFMAEIGDHPAASRLFSEALERRQANRVGTGRLASQVTRT